MGKLTSAMREALQYAAKRGKISEYCHAATRLALIERGYIKSWGGITDAGRTEAARLALSSPQVTK